MSKSRQLAAQEGIKFAWASYYPNVATRFTGTLPSPDSQTVSAKLTLSPFGPASEFPDSFPMCFDKSNGVRHKPYFVSADRLGNRAADCGDKLNDWAFQGRVEKATEFCGLTGYAHADVYYKGADQCLVASESASQTSLRP